MGRVSIAQMTQGHMGAVGDRPSERRARVTHMSATGRIRAHLSTALGPWSVGVRAVRSEGAASGGVSSLVAHRDIPTRHRPEWSQLFLGTGLPHWHVAFILYISKHVLKCPYVLSVLCIFVTGWLMARAAPAVARVVTGLMCVLASSGGGRAAVQEMQAL